MSYGFITDALAQRQAHGLLRNRSIAENISGREICLEGKGYLNFSSNDYLGLAASDELKKLTASFVGGQSFGSTGSSLLTGYHQSHHHLERLLCDWLVPDHSDEYAALLCCSGFSANVGTIKTLMNDANAVLIQDKLNHASLMDAGVEANAKMLRFKHNDMTHLNAKLNALPTSEIATSRAMIVTEGVFSMDGDQGNLSEIAKLVTQNKHTSKIDTLFMVDDAHGIGVLGERGSGTAHAHGLSSSDIDVRMVTFGKAIGTSGAAIVAKKPLIEYLLNFNRHYVYSTAISPLMANITAASIQIIQQQQWRRDKLHSHISLFQSLMSNFQHNDAYPSSTTAIQPVIIGEADKALKISEYLRNNGVWVNAIRPPTVPNGSARLRITLTANHTEQDIYTLCHHLNNAADKFLC
ncbi:aminotransferase class I/II-fold pyridoxal phosphate-dependent enzyme [Flocculibacter collagenilyticus]|uniref:aminotransferase class I/II-fold pyridoxal phosphate-dependent enzyme n=1 Tax=Flocculibacter collagenilyticus TaxID=2744479 RepID=UPI0018F5502A|nr:8-amino-7-oxononanoate synthase [Flocculibacter collagenilyticus]